MPAAIAIPLIVGAASAGASVYSAKKQSDAAKKASELQIGSQKTAQGFNQQVYNDQRQALNPYVMAGNDSLARLMQQHWGTGGMAPGMRGTAMAFGQQETPGSSYQPPPPGTMAPGMGQPPQPPNTAMPRFGGQMPQGPQAGGRPMPPMQGPPQGSPQGPPQQGGPMVMIQSPDGQTQAVPQQFAQAYVAKGGRIVG